MGDRWWPMLAVNVPVKEGVAEGGVQGFERASCQSHAVSEAARAFLGHWGVVAGRVRRASQSRMEVKPFRLTGFGLRRR
jgi:hypothetical protein